MPTVKGEALAMTRYYHGSHHELPIGEILIARPSHDSLHFAGPILEANRPKDAPSRKKTFYLVKELSDLDLAGKASGYSYVYEVEPISPFWCVDLAWTDIIENAGLVKEDDTNLMASIRQEQNDAATKYWKGIPSEEPLWECLAEKIKPIKLVRTKTNKLKAKLLR